MVLNYNLVIRFDRLTISGTPLMILFMVKVSFFLWVLNTWFMQTTVVKMMTVQYHDTQVSLQLVDSRWQLSMTLQTTEASVWCQEKVCVLLVIAAPCLSW